MNQERFESELLHASEKLDKLRAKIISKELIEKLGLDEQNALVMEECAELAVACSKYRRLKGARGARIHLIEEMADVLLSILKMQEMYNISTETLYKAMNVKLDRAEKKLKNGEVY